MVIARKVFSNIERVSIIKEIQALRLSFEESLSQFKYIITDYDGEIENLKDEVRNLECKIRKHEEQLSSKT